MRVETIISIVLAVILAISYIGLRIIRKKHMSDPEYMKLQEERMRMERMEQERERDMEEYMLYSDQDYSDQEYES